MSFGKLIVTTGSHMFLLPEVREMTPFGRCVTSSTSS